MLIDIIIFAALAIFLFIKLKGVLGNEYEDVPNTASNENKRKIKQVDPIIEETTIDLSEINSKNYIDQELLGQIKEISHIFPNFNAKSFIGATKKVFEIMLNSFATKDEVSISTLASKEISSRLIKSIQESISQNIKIVNILVAIDQAIIKKIVVSNNKVNISVFFESQQINYTESVEGKILEGSKGDINKISEIWEFEKANEDANSQWKLISIVNS